MLFRNLQITRSEIRPHIKWAVSLVVAYGHFILPQGFACVYVWANILTLSPPITLITSPMQNLSPDTKWGSQISHSICKIWVTLVQTILKQFHYKSGVGLMICHIHSADMQDVLPGAKRRAKKHFTPFRRLSTTSASGIMYHILLWQLNTWSIIFTMLLVHLKVQNLSANMYYKSVLHWTNITCWGFPLFQNIYLNCTSVLDNLSWNTAHTTTYLQEHHHYL